MLRLLNFATRENRRFLCFTQHLRSINSNESKTKEDLFGISSEYSNLDSGPINVRLNLDKISKSNDSAQNKFYKKKTSFKEKHKPENVKIENVDEEKVPNDSDMFGTLTNEFKNMYYTYDIFLTFY